MENKFFESIDYVLADVKEKSDYQLLIRTYDAVQMEDYDTFTDAQQAYNRWVEYFKTNEEDIPCYIALTADDGLCLIMIELYTPIENYVIP